MHNYKHIFNNSNKHDEKEIKVLPNLKLYDEGGYVGLAQMYLLLAGAVGTDNPFFESNYAIKRNLTVDKLDKLYEADYMAYIEEMDRQFT